MKTCRTCGESKPLTDFYKRKDSRDGREGWCKKCKTVQVRKWQEANADRFRASWDNPEAKRQREAHRYGLTVEELEQHELAAGGVCPICTRPRTLEKDHDHETGLFRGLICGPCNRAIGMLGDNAAGLQRALDYLRG